MLPPRGRELHSSVPGRPWSTQTQPASAGWGCKNEAGAPPAPLFIHLVTEGFISSCRAGQFSAGGGSVHVCWKLGASLPTCLRITVPRQCSLFFCTDYSIIFQMKCSLNYGGWLQSPYRNTHGFADPNEGRGSATATLGVMQWLGTVWQRWQDHEHEAAALQCQEAPMPAWRRARVRQERSRSTAPLPQRSHSSYTSTPLCYHLCARVYYSSRTVVLAKASLNGSNLVLSW